MKAENTHISIVDNKLDKKHMEFKKVTNIVISYKKINIKKDIILINKRENLNMFARETIQLWNTHEVAQLHS